MSKTKGLDEYYKAIQVLSLFKKLHTLVKSVANPKDSKYHAHNIARATEVALEIEKHKGSDVLKRFRKELFYPKDDRVECTQCNGKGYTVIVKKGGI